MVLSLIHHLSLFHFSFVFLNFSSCNFVREAETAVEFIIQDEVNNHSSAFSSQNHRRIYVHFLEQMTKAIISIFN